MEEQRPPQPDPDDVEESEDGPTGAVLPTPVNSGQTAAPSRAAVDSDDGGSDETPASPAPEPISWGKLTPEDRKRLLDEADPDELRKHDRIAGLSGQHATRLFQQRVGSLGWDDLPATLRDEMTQRVRKQIEDDRDAEARRNLGQQGEFYTLGQRDWEKQQARDAEQARAMQETEARQRVYKSFEQQTQAWAGQKFPEAVLQETARQITESGVMAGKSFDEQYQLWLDKAVTVATEHAATERIRQERDKWEKEELPSLKSRWLAERNGGEATPESGEGAPGRVRDLTDEMIRVMSPETFAAIWDDETNLPKQGSGWRYKPTNAVGLAQLKSMGGRG